MSTLEAVFRVCLFYGTVIQTAFVLVYLTRPWRKTAISKALLAKSVMLCLCLWAVEAHFYVEPLPFWAWALFAAGLAAAITWQFWVLLFVEQYAPPHLPEA